MSIRKTAVACASACLLCLGPVVAAAQTGEMEERQQYQHQPQQAEQPRGQQHRQARQEPRQVRPEQEPEQRAEPRERLATRGERGGNLFASLDRQQRRQVQERLQEDGHYQGEIDGIYGPRTRAALQEFQRESNLEASGTLNQETARRLGIEVSGEVERVAGTTGERGEAREQREGVRTSDRRQVREAQRALQREGFHDGAIDGMLGPMTERSIRDFQRAQGLRETGDLTPQTLAVLGVREGREEQAAQEQPERRGEQSPQSQRGTQESPQRQREMDPERSNREGDIYFEGNVGQVDVN